MSSSITLYLLRQGLLLNLDLANLVAPASRLTLGEPLASLQSTEVTGRFRGSEGSHTCTSNPLSTKPSPTRTTRGRKGRNLDM